MPNCYTHRVNLRKNCWIFSCGRGFQPRFCETQAVKSGLQGFPPTRTSILKLTVKEYLTITPHHQNSRAPVLYGRFSEAHKVVPCWNPDTRLHRAAW